MGSYRKLMLEYMKIGDNVFSFSANRDKCNNNKIIS